MKEITLNRQQLYDLVWTESILSLSKKYAISDVGLRKKCKSLEIPVPNLGYWAKLKFGKRVLQRRPLRPFNGNQTVTLKLREENEVTKITRFALVKQIEADRTLDLTVPEKLTNPDKLISALKDDLYKKKVLNREEGLVHNSPGFLNISVSPHSIGRSLRLLDTLIKALKKRGHEIIVEGNQTWITIDGEKQSISCSEKLSRFIKEEGKHFNYYGYKASGLLSLRVNVSNYSKEWSDGKKPVESQLANVIVYLEIKAAKIKEERLKNERYWAEQREKERVAKEIQDRKIKELAEFKELFTKAKRHDNAEKIRRYAEQWERYAVANNLLTDELKTKIEWARRKADWYDPFVEARDEWMDGIDREELKMESRTFYWLTK